MTLTDYDRLLQAAMHEFEAGARRLVEREFASLPTNADEIAAPITGDKFNPRDGKQLAAHKQRAVAALLAQHWCKDEIPRSWRLTLPLRAEDCYAMFNDAHRQRHLGGEHAHKLRRARLVSEYGIHLRQADWNLKYATPFELFVAQKLGA